MPAYNWAKSIFEKVMFKLSFKLKTKDYLEKGGGGNSLLRRGQELWGTDLRGQQALEGEGDTRSRWSWDAGRGQVTVTASSFKEFF